MYNLFVTRPSRSYCYAWTMHGAQHEIGECAECGRKTLVASNINEDSFLVIEGGKKLPDFLEFCGVGAYLLVSSTVVDVFTENNISGYFIEKTLPLFRDVKGQMLKVDGIQYYSLKVTGTVDFDLKAMHLKKKHICKSCGHFDWSIQRLSSVDTKFDMDTWDQSDICRISSSPGHIVCSDKVVELINQRKLTGVQIQEEKDAFRIR